MVQPGHTPIIRQWADAASEYSLKIAFQTSARLASVNTSVAWQGKSGLCPAGINPTTSVDDRTLEQKTNIRCRQKHIEAFVQSAKIKRPPQSSIRDGERSVGDH
jgi:hypothetical protein